MATLKIKYLRGAITMFALCLIGTASATPNGDEKEEKKEVKVEKTTLLIPLTFEIDVSSATDQNIPSQQFITGEGVTDEDCGTSNVTICSAEMDLNPSDPDVIELRNKIANNEPVTVQDFLNLDPNLEPAYSHKP